MTTSSDFGSSEELERLKRILADWRTSLVDLSGRNRLLHFRHTAASTLEITHPSPFELIEKLERGWEFAPLPDVESESVRSDSESSGIPQQGPERGDGIVTQKKTDPALNRALSNLRRKSTQLFNDYGLSPLQLGIGMLHWCEDGATAGSDAPLILLPVSLERTANGRIRLVASEDDEPRLNPALRLKAEQMHVDWAPVAGADPTDLAAVWDAVASIVSEKPKWKLSERVVLALFASQKESMYQDLLDHEADVLRSDLVKAVALGPGAALAPDRFDFEEIEIDQIDYISPPEEVPLVLDADASQRQAITAAVAGRSFVLDGPPGTGKSQTITNIIAGLMHAGRSVLFVSEKAAALDVVLDRMRSVGLDSYVLALHSHNTSRRAVAKELGRALEEEPRAPQLDQHARSEARATREALSGYAMAMNEVREPLGQTLHDLIGRIEALSSAPVAYWQPAGDNDFSIVKLESRDLYRIREAAREVSRSWAVVVDRSHPWRGVRRDANSRPALEQAEAALDAHVESLRPYSGLCPESVESSDERSIRRMLALVDLLGSRYPVPQTWLTAEDFDDEVEEPVYEFLEGLGRVQGARSAAQAAAGEHWEDLSSRLTAGAGPAELELSMLAPAGLDVTSFDEAQALRLANEFKEIADRLGHIQSEVSHLARLSGSPEPSTLDDARNLCEVVLISGESHRPLSQWLTPGGPDQAYDAAIRLVADHLGDFAARRDRAIGARTRATMEAGPGWNALAEMATPECLPQLGTLRSAGVKAESMTRSQIAECLDWFRRLTETLDICRDRAGMLSSQLGYVRAASTAQASDLIALANLANADDRALADWFDPTALANVRAVSVEIHSAVDKLEQANGVAGDVFTAELLALPEVSRVIGRLEGGAQGLGGMLSRQVRTDRRLLGSVAVSGAWRSEFYGKLPAALAWISAHEELKTLLHTHEDLFGRYVGWDNFSLESIDVAIAHAESVHRLVPELMEDPRHRDLLAAQLADEFIPDSDLQENSAVLQRELSTWQKNLSRWHSLEQGQLLLDGTLQNAATWFRSQLEPLRSALELLDMVSSVGDRSSMIEHTLASAQEAIESAIEARRTTFEFEASASADRNLLDGWYQSLDTDITRIAPIEHGFGAESATADDLLGRAMQLNGVTHLDRFATDSDSALLGRFAASDELDTSDLWNSIESARQVLRLAPTAIASPGDRLRLAAIVADGYPVAQDALNRANGIRAQLENCERDIRLYARGGAGPELLRGTIDLALRWFKTHVRSFTEATETVRRGSRYVCGTESPTLSAVRKSILLVNRAKSMEQVFWETERRNRELLGDLFSGILSNHTEIRDSLKWSQSVRRTAHGGRSLPLTDTAARLMCSAPTNVTVASLYSDWIRQRDNLIRCFEVDRAVQLQEDLTATNLAAAELLSRMLEDPFGPEQWIQGSEALTLLHEYGLEELPAQLDSRGVSAEEFPAAVERAVLTSWVEHQFSTDARLAPHSAIDRDNLVERFRGADRELVESAHADVIAACNARRPRRISIGSAALIRREAEKQRKHMPVRRLLGETRDVVQSIKPCFMMSPLTVSQFLPLGLRFDVVIFDEASQVLPQDAVNSLYRADALIVAGDQKQLPPTSFFNVANDSDDDEWDDDGGDGFESILDACKASGILRSLPLRWHYRSRHENLIAFSNHEFYENTMVTFPGALESGPDIGVEFFKSEGVYGIGGRSNNPGEALTVAQRVIHHFETRPGLSLGVVALSKAQAEVIELEIEKARAGRPELERFFTEDRLDGFFVKNLESVQGDERDVIILSIGYGPNEHGKLHLRFGPINREGGWRRLNVAVTRARSRIELVASFRGGDLADSGNKSIQHLKRYLQFAEIGPQILQTQEADPDALPESPFEEEVIEVLRGWGYTVQPQVGVAGFRIDMAIRNPAAPGSYALGIECDGAMYHSSRAARDRDRLREEVLRGLGWKLHRIWGTDWYRNRRDAIERLRAAVQRACEIDQDSEAVTLYKGLVEPPKSGASDDVHQLPSVRSVDVVKVESGPPKWSRPYPEVGYEELSAVRTAATDRRSMYWVELQDPRASDAVAEVILWVIDKEGPIEEDLIVVRVRSAWDLSRSGAVIQKTIRSALDRLASKGEVENVGTSYDMPKRTVDVARTPTVDYVRKVLQVPTLEREFAIERMVMDAPGASADELLREVARFFGWSRIGADIRTTLTLDIERLLARGVLHQDSNGLVRRIVVP